MTTGSLPPALSPTAPPENDETQSSLTAGRQWLALAVALAVWATTVAWLPCPASAQPPSDQEPPLVELGESSLRISGVTPGGAVAWFGVARGSGGHVTYIYSRQDLAEADEEGVVWVELDEAPPRDSIWFAADLQTGELGAAAPEGSRMAGLPLPPQAIVGAADRLDLPQRQAYVFWVRPGTGAWWRYGGDGGASDEGQPGNGRVMLSLAGLRPFGESPEPPARLGVEDLLVTVTPETMEYRILALGEAR